jgi:hypothetical protein
MRRAGGGDEKLGGQIASGPPKPGGDKTLAGICTVPGKPRHRTTLIVRTSRPCRPTADLIAMGRIHPAGAIIRYARARP